jgi:hypothetical protein
MATTTRITSAAASPPRPASIASSLALNARCARARPSGRPRSRGCAAGGGASGPGRRWPHPLATSPNRVRCSRAEPPQRLLRHQRRQAQQPRLRPQRRHDFHQPGIAGQRQHAEVEVAVGGEVRRQVAGRGGLLDLPAHQAQPTEVGPGRPAQVPASLSEASRLPSPAPVVPLATAPRSTTVADSPAAAHSNAQAAPTTPPPPTATSTAGMASYEWPSLRDATERGEERRVNSRSATDTAEVAGLTQG